MATLLGALCLRRHFFFSVLCVRVCVVRVRVCSPPCRCVCLYLWL